MEKFFDTDIRYVKGIGPRNAALLGRLGISSVGGLLRYLPFRTEDRRRAMTASEILKAGIADTNIFFAGFIKKISAGRSPRRRSRIVEITVEDPEKTGSVRLWAFRSRVKYITGVLKTGMKIAVYGKAEIKPDGISMTSFEFEIIDDKKENLSFYRLFCIYRLTKGLSVRRFTRWVRNALDLYMDRIREFIPGRILRRLKLPGRKWAFEKVHFPDDFEVQARAYRRLKFEDFFIFECAVAYNMHSMKKKVKPHGYVLKKNILTPWKKSLPFSFTQGQKNAIREIFADMLSPRPMRRLLQGDVGCGKTVVAAAGALLAKENGLQTALLAPTLPLAAQHYETLGRLLEGTDVSLTLLTGGLKKSEKDKRLSEIASGGADIVIGTHAMLAESVRFPNLSLIIIDEQQRFGVHQKAALSGKASEPDMLVLTATPIPRALALTLFGDLEKTEIRGLPPGRKAVETLHLGRREAYAAIRKEIETGAQAFIIYPLIEDNDSPELFSAEAAYKYLSKDVFADFKVSLLHGRMSPDKKRRTMEDFANGKSDILVSTTVVEVGVDVPNATVMLIENAQRYGLSTLHQLRGRIGRGTRQSRCMVTTSSSADTNALKRVSFFLNCSDGFELAEKDLEMRGSGQYFGVAQHGSMDVHFNYNRTLEEKFPGLSDINLLKQARSAAFELLRQDPYLKKNPVIRELVFSRFGPSFHLASAA